MMNFHATRHHLLRLRDWDCSNVMAFPLQKSPHTGSLHISSHHFSPVCMDERHGHFMGST